MKKEIVKLLKWLVPVLLLELLVGSYLRFMFSQFSGATNGNPVEITGLMNLFGTTPGESLFNLQLANILIGWLPHVVVGVWLWKLEKPNGAISILWFVASILMKYWVLLLYFAYRFSEKLVVRSNENP